MKDQNEIKRLRAVISAALAKEGYECELGNWTYTDNQAWFKVNILSAGQEAKEIENWNRYCFKFGLRPEDFGARFMYDMEEYQVTGIRPRARKYPIACVRLSDSHTDTVFPASTFRAGRMKETV